MISFEQRIQLFDFLDTDGNNLMQIWADAMPMQKKDRARLDNRIDLLERVEANLLPGLLHPTKCRHIMHLKVNGDVALRPMLCRGPFDIKNEFTFLLGTTERDRKLVDRKAPEKAEINRTNLLTDPRRRCQHERFYK